MFFIRDDCVGCPPEMGCSGVACPYQNQKFYICDDCGENAIYHIKDKDLCLECANEVLNYEFENMPTINKAQVLNVKMTESKEYWDKIQEERENCYDSDNWRIR